MRKIERSESLSQDVRYAWRSLRRSPGFVGAAVLILALGLGANGALFTILDQIYFRAPAGVDNPTRVLRLFRKYTDAHKDQHIVPALSAPEWRQVAAAATVGSIVSGYRTESGLPLGKDGNAPKGVVAFVIGDYFGALGVRLVGGRPFIVEEFSPETFAPVAVISYDLAYARGFTERTAIGQSIDIGSHRYAIIGVAPRGFRGTELDAVDVWVPMNTRGTWNARNQRWYENRGTASIRTIVRIPNLSGVAAALTAATVALRADARPTDPQPTASLGSLRDALAPGSNTGEQAIATRLAAVALAILLIACANVSNLILARALGRRREIGVRLALGVSRSRLIQQLMIESVLLGLLAGVAAVFMAAWGSTALRHILLPDVQWAPGVLSLRTVLFCGGVAIVAGLATGAMPAIHASRPDVTQLLKEGSRAGLSRSRIRGVLLVSQLALSCVLLAGAGLFIRSLGRIESVNLGYDDGQIIIATVRADPELGRRDVQIDALLKDAASRIERLPGVERVAFSENAPLSAVSLLTHFLPDRDSVPTLDGYGPIVSFISPGFMATMGVRVIQGREFDLTDRVGAEPVLLVNSLMAQTMWPGESAVGKCLILRERTNRCRRIVGVVSNSHFRHVLERSSMQFYVPIAQEGDSGQAGNAGALIVRARPGQTDIIAAQVNQLLAERGGAGTWPTVRTLSAQLAPELRTWRIGALLFSAAGLLAIVVAAVGVYATVSYGFNQRRREIGVRLALGAQANSIMLLVLKGSAGLAGLGVGIGLLLTLLVGRFAAPLLFQTSEKDPVILGAVGILLFAVVIASSLIPAFRTRSVDPIEALRTE